MDRSVITWALIFLIGVAPPDAVDLEPVERDLKHLDIVSVLQFYHWFLFLVIRTTQVTIPGVGGGGAGLG